MGARWVGPVAATALLAGSLLTGTAVPTAAQAAAPAAAAQGSLPGGTSIEADITTPADDARFAPGPVTVAGTASVGTGEPVADTALVYVFDLSGSTLTNPGCGGDENDDGDPGTVLDCEVAAAMALNSRAAALGTIGDVGAAGFGTIAAPADVGPGGGIQLLTGPAADVDGRDGPDIEQVITSVRSGGLALFTDRVVGESTNFAAGITAATEVARESDNRRTIVVFMSDGQANAGDGIEEPLAEVPDDVVFHTFAIGDGSSCENPNNPAVSLARIAEATGGACSRVDSPGDLPGVLPGVIASELTSLELRVDGGTPRPVTDVTPALPRDGPDTVGYVTRTPDLRPGDHTVCVTARGRDGGGTGDVTACHTLTVIVDEGPPGPGIAVTIDSPPDLAVLPPGPVRVTGTASIGQGRELSDAAVVYVLDVSGSTDEQVAGGCGGDRNGDGRADRVLDCEIAAAMALNERAVLGGTLTEVGAAVFGTTAATADVGPARGEQFVTAPSADLDRTGGRDIDQVLASAFSEGGGDGGVGRFTRKQVGADTNFADAVTRATTVAQASGKARKIVAFLSDGVATVGGSLTEPLADVPDNVDFFTFAVGAGSSCENPDNENGSLAEIARATGGRCTEITDVADLPAVLPGLITSTLTTLTLRVDGGSPVPITEVVPPLPATGPVQAAYAVTVADPTAGDHTLCVTAAGMESGRGVDVTDCHVVTVVLPVLAVEPLLGPPGLVTRAVGSGFPPGGRVRLSWSVGLSETPGEVGVGPDGRLDAQVLVFHGDLVGLRELIATPVTGPQFTARSQPFLVVPRSLQPPDFQVRR